VSSEERQSRSEQEELAFVPVERNQHQHQQQDEGKGYNEEHCVCEGNNEQKRTVTRSVINQILIELPLALYSLPPEPLIFRRRGGFPSFRFPIRIAGQTTATSGISERAGERKEAAVKRKKRDREIDDDCCLCTEQREKREHQKRISKTERHLALLVQSTIL
jgi:hypothetical protein